MANQSITPLFHYNIAKNFYDAVRTKTGYYSHFLSNTTPWEDLSNVPSYGHTNEEENVIRSNMISVKNIEIANLSYMIPDIKWESGTVYTMYDDETDMYNTNFYSIVDSNIYKCISNNSGSTSSIAPSGTNIFNFELDDGYIWKFMGSIPRAFSNKFSGSGYVPISTSEYNRYYIAGSILPTNIIIEDGGSDYDSQAKVEITGDGTGATASLVLNGDGEIVHIILTNPGIGYTYANLTVTNGSGTDPGSGADIEIFIPNNENLDLNTTQEDVEAAAVDGSLSSVVITSGGSGYSSEAYAEITGDGTGAEVELEIVNGIITGALITSDPETGAPTGYGAGYHNINIDVVDTSSSPGTGGVIRPILSPRGGHGFDLPRELFSQVLCLYTTLEDDLNHGVPILNEYNQTGLIKNVRKFENTSLFTSLLGSSLYNISTNNIQESYININDLVYSSGNKYKIISYNSDKSNILLQPIDHNIAPTATSFYIDSTQSTLSFEGVSIVNNPSIDKYSGDIILAENRQTFSVSGEFGDSDQGVKFKTFISF
jgi:hypothetical protein